MPQVSLLNLIDGNLRTNLKCSACSLCEPPALRTNRMGGFGSISPTYMIIGHAPGIEDDQLGKPMTGKNGRLLKELLALSGINAGDCYFSNCLRCHTFRTKPQLRQWKACQAYLIDEIARLNPKVIIASGAQAMEWLTGQTQIRKLRKRGLPCILPVGNRLVFPIQQPAALFHAEGQEQVDLKNQMVEDLVWIRQQFEQGTLTRGGDIETTYRVARTKEDVDELFHALHTTKEPIATDLETGSIEWQPMLFPTEEGRIVAAGFSFGFGTGWSLPVYAKGVSSFLYWENDYIEKEILPRLRKFYQERTVFGHNFVAFDQKWIRAGLGVDYCKIDFDTMLAHYLIDEERGTHGLERLALLYTTMPPWKASFTLEDTDTLSYYLCRDVDATWRIRQKLESQLDEKQWWLLKELLLPCGNVLMDVEYNGVCVSKEGLEKLSKILQQKISSAEFDLRRTAPVRAYEVAANEAFNYNSPEQVGELLQKYLKLVPKEIKNPKFLTASGKISTDKEMLNKFSGNAVVAKILELRQLNKLKSTYCDGIAENVIDGRLHTSYKLHGTVTGRLASENPNLQNEPKEETVAKVLDDGSLIKALFIPDDADSLIVQADYSQIELRVMACLADDPALRKIYIDDLDAHTATAATVLKKPLEQVTKAERGSAKSVNFGIIFGMSEASLIEKFIAAGNSESEAKMFYAAHQQQFSNVWKFMQDQEELIRTVRYQETPFGRRRRYGGEIGEREKRQAYNYKIQSAAADLTLMSLARIKYAIDQMKLPARIILTVYDSIALSVKKHALFDVCAVMKHMMESMRFSWLTVPIKVDLEAGPDWGHLKKVKLGETKLEDLL